MNSITLVQESYNTYLGSVASQLGISLQSVTLLMSIIALWALAWKGVALWKAASKQKSLIWFIILLIINDFGLLEILYIFWFSKIISRQREKTKIVPVNPNKKSKISKKSKNKKAKYPKLD